MEKEANAGENPTLEDFNKMQKAYEETKTQLSDRNQTIKELKGKLGDEGENPATTDDSDKLQTIVEEKVSSKLNEVLDPLVKENEELKATLSGQPGTPLSTGGSEVKAKETSRWTDEQLAAFEKLGVDPAEVAENEKRIQKG